MSRGPTSVQRLMDAEAQANSEPPGTVLGIGGIAGALLMALLAAACGLAVLLASLGCGQPVW